MIDPNTDKLEKLKQARDAFEASYEHYSDCNEERRLWARCHHNTEGKGQWPESVIRTLEEENRPYWSFNLVHGKVHTFVGMQRDVRRSPVARPVGREDRFLAGVLNTISDRIRYKARASRSDAAVLRDGAIRGEGDGQLYVSADPKRPKWRHVEYKHLSPHQVHWDPSSVEHDRSDARFVCISTWMDKGTFSRRYPEHATHFDTLRKGSLVGDSRVLEYDTEISMISERPDEYDKVRTSKYYFDEKRKMIRVISVEYKCPVKRWFLVSETGETKALDDQQVTGFDGEPLEGDAKRDMVEAYIRLDMLPGVQLLSSSVDETYWLEFVGSEILYDKKSPMPFDGFSIEPFVFYLDDETNTPYGMVRNLVDPQTQVNKSYCLQIEASASQAKPGTDIEESAHSDPDLLEDQGKIAGSVRVFKDGAISGNKVRERQPPVASTAAEQRLANDVKLFHEVSCMYPETEQVRQAEAGITHQLRNHKARLVHMDPFEAFEDYQIGMERRIIETIIRAMPDDQIASLLGNDEKYRVQRTPTGVMIYEIEMDPRNPQGQPRVVNQAPFQMLRTLEADIELEASSENTELRMVEFGILSGLASTGIPVPPELVLERAIQNRGDRELAIDYAKQVAQASAQAQKEANDNLAQQITQTIKIQAAAEQERARHNVAEENIKTGKAMADWVAEMAAIWEKADSNEKARLFETFKMIQQRAMEQDQLQARFAQSNTGQLQ